MRRSDYEDLIKEDRDFLLYIIERGGKRLRQLNAETEQVRKLPPSREKIKRMVELEQTLNVYVEILRPFTHGWQWWKLGFDYHRARLWTWFGKRFVLRKGWVA